MVGLSPGSTFEQAEKDNLFGVILRQDNPTNCSHIPVDWIRYELLKFLEATVILQFQESCKQNDRFHLSCFDPLYYKWTKNAVSSLEHQHVISCTISQTLLGAQVETGPGPVSPPAVSRVIRLLAGQNRSIHTERWTLRHQQDSTNGQVLVWGMWNR